MRALKFLRAGRVGPFSGTAWAAPGAGDEPGAWLGAGGAPSLCRAGVHACRPADLPLWICEELWRVELGGEVTAAPDKLVAPRGRLLGRVEAWDVAAADELASACAARAGALGDAGDGYSADAAGCARDASRRDGAPAFAAAATCAYIAAHAAAGAAGDPDAYAAERAWQAEWMAERLGLVGS